MIYLTIKPELHRAPVDPADELQRAEAIKVLEARLFPQPTKRPRRRKDTP